MDVSCQTWPTFSIPGQGSYKKTASRFLLHRRVTWACDIDSVDTIDIDIIPHTACCVGSFPTW